MSKRSLRVLLMVVVFAIAMGFLETAVVVYLRKLYYPGGFSFPLQMIDGEVALTEFLREVATLFMLIGIGVLAGRNRLERFAYFIFSFAIWDIFYYVFLYALLQWPASLFTWDVLFLIPVTWVGPVLAPVINSMMMILLAILIVYFTDQKGRFKLGWPAWALLILGSLVVLFSYTEEYVRYMLQRFDLSEIIGVSNQTQVLEYASAFIPVRFNWWIFILGALMHLAGFILVYLNNRRKRIVAP